MKTLLPALIAFFCIVAVPLNAKEAPKKAAQWVEQKNPAFLAERQADGDSFGMTVESPKGKRVKRTYRLYGADCPECGKEPFVKERIEEQAEHFAVTPEEIPAWGKRAADFTRELLIKGKPRVFTFGPMGVKARKVDGRPQRYYALVEVTAPDGRRRWLHELLIENGLARAKGEAAPWPQKELDRHGEAKSKAKFMRHLETLETKSKNQRVGAWRKKPGG